MAERPFRDQKTIRARAWCLGERIDVHALERGDTLALSPVTVRAGERGCAMLFRYGAIVLFELDPAEEVSFLRTLAPLVTGGFDTPESESADIEIAPEHAERVSASGAVLLREASLERLQVVAHILAKSAVLSHYEERIAGVFERIEPLAEGLRRGARGRARSRDLLRQIGDVLLTQTRTVGRVEVSEKPEITWDRPELDRLYERLVVEYELRERDHSLERRLALIAGSAQSMLEIVQNRRSLRVEWYIVILIAVEIVLIVYDLFAEP
jgi:uncharacterized Rmd1/YagE family protein